MGYASSGGLVGIDFGHAFGTATQYLPIPELMPFRLTRQMIGVCRPHSTSGTLKHAMVYTLSALRVRACCPTGPPPAD